MNRNTANAVRPKEREEHRGKILRMKPPQPPRPQKIRAAGAFTLTVSRVLAIATVLFLACATIYTSSEITRVNDLLGKGKKQYEQLKAEETRLNIELENKVSFNHIEEAAKELGMRKKDYRQVNYIRLDDDDRIIIEEPSTNSMTANKK